MWKIRFTLLLVAILLLGLLLSGVAGAADTPDAIIRHVFGSAGQKVAAGQFILSGTLGEPATGPFVVAGDKKVASGYWRGITFDNTIYLPIVNR